MIPTPIPPGSTIGVLGGGPMGRMTALAGRALGYRVHVLDADPACTAEDVADRSVRAPLSDMRAVNEVARGCQVITTSVEQVPVFTLEAVARFAPVRPGAGAVAIAQDRARERTWLEERGAQVGPWRAADTRDALLAAVAELGGACYVKPRLRRAEDAGPILVTGAGEASAAWIAVRGRPCVVERALPIELELSVLVARSPSGASRTYPAAVSEREHARLLWSVVPGALPAPLATKAERLASFIAARLGLEGLLTVEMFLLRDGRLVVNELVPCPHRTFHATEQACATNQFEQLVRAITGLPLGATQTLQPGASAGVPGELWHGGKVPRFAEALRMPGVRLQLYGTPAPIIGRTMGHLSAVGATPDEAVQTVLRAAAHLPADRTRRAIARRRLLLPRRRPAQRGG
jgi:5-(carboxyamino)imidazole ribonucleotide synthase